MYEVSFKDAATELWEVGASCQACQSNGIV